MNRRIATALMGAGALPSRLLPAGVYQPRFFTTEEFRSLDDLSEMILPADEQSPGAREARVAEMIDLIVASSSASVQKQWRAGLASFGTPSREAIERAGQTPFFTLCKSMVVKAYYTSEVGVRKELGYTGPAAIAKFPGCQ